MKRIIIVEILWIDYLKRLNKIRKLHRVKFEKQVTNDEVFFRIINLHGDSQLLLNLFFGCFLADFSS